MTVYELALLLTTAGISGYGFAAVCGAVLDRVGRPEAPQAVRTSDVRR